MTKFKDVIFEENVAIHCPEEWMDENIREALGDIGYRWNKSSVNVKVHSNWSKYENDSCINLENNDIMRFDKFEYYKEEGFNILHYDDVAIKDETSLDYELIIKGRRAVVGDKLWLKLSTGITNVIIDEILIYSVYHSRITLINESREKTVFQLTNLEFIKSHLFWEKPILYQLPDTDGNLSEVKIGRHVWLRYNDGHVYKCVISEFNGNNIEIMSICDSGRIYASNKEGLTFSGGMVTTNKPSRFHGKQDWSQAPKEAVEWRVTVDGYAFWYSNAYCERSGLDYDYDCGMYYISAGYRADLLNENGVVEDWEYSLVKRPEGK